MEKRLIREKVFMLKEFQLEQFGQDPEIFEYIDELKRIGVVHKIGRIYKVVNY